MFADGPNAHPWSSETPESKFRLRMMVAELWHEWFGTMSQMAYQAHKACEFLAENGSLPGGQHGPFDPRSRGPVEWPSGAVDMEKLKQCLQSMDPAQAARVMHAVQTMQAMEAMLKAYRSRTNEFEGAPW
jgi:hypothetical protein